MNTVLARGVALACLAPALPAAPQSGAPPFPPARLVHEAVLPIFQGGVSGDTIAGTAGGEVLVFVDGPAGWTVEATLTPEPGDLSYNIVDLDGDLLAAGHFESPPFGGIGAVYVFERSGTTWTKSATFPLADLGAKDVSVCCGRVAVATRFDAFVYASAGGTWGLEASFPAGGGPEAVALAADRLAVHTPGSLPSSTGVTVYARTGTSWQLEDVLDPPTGLVLLGSDLAIERDASLLVAGDWGFDNAFVYRRSGTTWTEEARFSDPKGFFNELFGDYVAVADGRVYVGDWTTPGGLYAYEHDGADWSLDGEVPPLPVAANFGQDLDADGDLVIADGRLFGNSVFSVFRVVPDPLAYCTAKTTSGGCLASIDSTGRPSEISAFPFVITARDVPNAKNGLLFYGTSGRASLPFLGGTLCALPPLQRTPVQNAGGSPPPADDCSGGLVFDFNAWLQAGSDPALAPGVQAHGQFWFRDPPDTFGAALSDALELTILD